MDYEKARATILILNVMLCSSYPLNFAIYCGMSRLETKPLSPHHPHSERDALLQLSTQLCHLLRDEQVRNLPPSLLP